MTVAVFTVGCRLNQAESDCLRGRLLSSGADIVPGWGCLPYMSPDGDACPTSIYINTCAVTRSAERSSLALIRQACRLKPKPKVVVLGCLAQSAPERVRAIAGVDEVWSNQQKQVLIDRVCPVPSRSRALLKVQDGCDRGCAFCLPSRLRGAPVSVPINLVVEQFDRLLLSGFQEVVLTGLNLCRYQSEGKGLAGLLSALLKRPGRFRIRLASLEPDLIDDELIALFADPKICAHFHLPLQSADEKILFRMGRCYTVNDYARRLEQLLRVKPDACIGADVIVGFPGEDDASFARTYDFLLASAVSYLHVFPYSLRPGTPAFQFGDPVPREKKAERVRKLRQLSEEKRLKYARRFCGQVREAVSEPGARALTDNYLRLSPDAACIGARRNACPTLLSPDGDARLKPCPTLLASGLSSGADIVPGWGCKAKALNLQVCFARKTGGYQPGKLVCMEINIRGEKIIGRMREDRAICKPKGLPYKVRGVWGQKRND